MGPDKGKRRVALADAHQWWYREIPKMGQFSVPLNYKDKKVLTFL